MNLNRSDLAETVAFHSRGWNDGYALCAKEKDAEIARLRALLEKAEAALVNVLDLGEGLTPADGSAWARLFDCQEASAAIRAELAKEE